MTSPSLHRIRAGRIRSARREALRDRTRKLTAELLEQRLALASQWVSFFGGMAPGETFEQQLVYGQNLLHESGVQDSNARAVAALDLSGAFLVETAPSATLGDVTSYLQGVPGFVYATEYTEPNLADLRKVQPAKIRYENEYGPFDYDQFLTDEKNGRVPDGSGWVDQSPPGGGPPPPPPDDGSWADVRTNNNTGAGGAANFTQSETTILAYGNNVIVGFNDSGSFTGGANKFTGWAYSTDGGLSFFDGGTLPTNAIGDAGDPVMARDNTTGRIYYSTLGFSGAGTIQMFRSDDNAVSWMAPVNATPGGSFEDKQWLVVDNFAGAGNGNVYLLSRRFSGSTGVYFFRSTDNGATFGPNGGTLLAPGSPNRQGAYIAVAPDHTIYAFYFHQATPQRLVLRKSTDFGVTFGPEIEIGTLGATGTNGGAGLTGQRQGTSTFNGFRNNAFLHAAINPVSGHIYVTYGDDPTGTDKGNIFMKMSTDAGVTWSAAVQVNDDSGSTDQWQPTITVSPDGGKLGIFYYSRHEDAANNNLFRFFGRIGIISGSTVTFQPSFAISDVQSLPEFGRDNVVNGVYMGDYDTAVSTPGAFHVIWADNRDDLAGGSPRKDPNTYYEKIPLGLAVATTNPAVNQVVSAIPLNYVVNFTDPIQAATVQASDFTVDGVPANSFVVNTTTQVTFQYASAPFATQGLHTMAMAAGAILRDPDGDPLAPFSGPFRYDAVIMQVDSTVPPVGGTFTLPGPFTYDVNLNEPFAPASLQTSDLALTGIGGAFVGGAIALDADTIRFTIGGVTAEGALTATINAGALTDVFGNSNAAFSGTYQVDIGTVPYPTPLLAKNPPGSLIYDPAAPGLINFVADNDNFTLAVDPGQRISVIVTPTAPGLTPRVELFDPSSASLGFNVAAAAGQVASLQTLSAAAGGTYRISVQGSGGTTGAYTVSVILNAAFEAEGRIAGATNHTLATAQNIDSSFITVSTPQTTALRGGALAVSDSTSYTAAAVTFAFENINATGTVITSLTGTDDSAATITPGFTFNYYGSNFTSFGVSSNGLITFSGTDANFTNTDLTTSPTLATIAPFWDDFLISGVATSRVLFQVLGAGVDQHLTVQWNEITFFSGGTSSDTLTFQAQLYADGRIRYNYLDLVSGSAGGNNGGSATVGIKAAGTQGPNRLLLAFNNGPNTFVGTGQSTLISPPNPTADYFAFSAAAGDRITVGVDAAVGLELRNSSDLTLVVGATGSTNLSRAISNFVIATTGTYYARITGGAAPIAYSLLVTRNSSFDTEPNDSFAGAQAISGMGAVLGAIAPTNVYQAAAIPFGFENIGSTGTVITALTGTDDAAVTITPGFTFSLYGTSYSSFGVSSNGLITFAGLDANFTNTNLTTSPTFATIAPLWDDFLISGSTSSGVLYQVLGVGLDQHLTIQWNQITFFSGGTASDTLTFQAQLYIDGRIRFNYLDLVSGGAAGNNGGSASVGIKAAGTQGPNRMLLAFNVPGGNTFVGTSKSTLISLPPGEDWYSVNVTNPASALRLESSTPGDGSGEPANVLNPRIELYDPMNAVVATGILQPDGRNEFINYVPFGVGLYRVRIFGESSTIGDYFLTENFAPVLSGVTISSPINENGVATLSGSISDPDVADTFIVVVNWGEGAPQSYSYSAGTTSFSVTHQYLDDNPSATTFDVYPVAVTVTDNHGGGDSESTSVRVNNVAPDLGTLSRAIMPLDPDAVISSPFIEPGTQDTHGVVIDWGDGAITPGTAIGGVASGTHTYGGMGFYPVTMTITDDDTGTDVATMMLLVSGIDVINGQLVILGTNFNDEVRVQLTEDGSNMLRVTASFLPAPGYRDYPAPGISSVVMRLGSGDDLGVFAGNMNLPGVLDGGDDNDHINAGGGNAVLLGGAGNDLLQGSVGNDILIGGLGSDLLDGGSQQDILIGGQTAYDNSDAALLALLAEWNSSRGIVERVDNIRNGLGPILGGTGRRLTKGGATPTVFDDGAYDELLGYSGQDWYFHLIGEDRIEDFEAGEFEN